MKYWQSRINIYICRYC